MSHCCVGVLESGLRHTFSFSFIVLLNKVRKVCFSVVLKGLGLLHMNKSSSNFTGKERMIGLPIKISHFPSAL